MSAVKKAYYQEQQKRLIASQEYQEWLGFLAGGEDKMHWKNTGSNVDFDPPPVGTHLARCYQVIDLGTQYNKLYDNTQHKVFIGFELPNEIHTWKDSDNVEQQGPFVVGEFYTCSLNEKSNLRKTLEAWRGQEFTEKELEGFHAKNIIGVPALITIIHVPRENKKPRARIASISKPMKGMVCPEAFHPPVYFSFEDFSQKDLEQVSKGFQDLIKKSEEWQSLQGMAKVATEATKKQDDFIDDDIPF